MGVDQYQPIHVTKFRASFRAPHQPCSSAVIGAEQRRVIDPQLWRAHRQRIGVDMVILGGEVTSQVGGRRSCHRCACVDPYIGTRLPGTRHNAAIRRDLHSDLRSQHRHTLVALLESNSRVT